MSSPDPPDAERGYRLLAPGGSGAGVVGACRLAWVEGPDAEGFLHGLLTCDVAALATGGASPALLLTARGHIVAAMTLVREGPESFTLVLPPGPAPEPVEALHGYHFSEDLDILGPEPSGLLVVAGAGADRLQGAADLVLPGEVPGTHALVTDDPRGALAALGLPEAPAEALEALRVEAGVPRVGRDTGPSTLVQEAGLEAAVSYDKGCYLGQETVARLHYRGHANRTLRGLALAGPAPPGAAVTAGGRAAGRLTSAAVSPRRGAVGLAILRREVAPGDEVDVEGAGRARVVELPFP